MPLFYTVNLPSGTSVTTHFRAEYYITTSAKSSTQKNTRNENENNSKQYNDCTKRNLRQLPPAFPLFRCLNLLPPSPGPSIPLPLFFFSYFLSVVRIFFPLFYFSSISKSLQTRCSPHSSSVIVAPLLNGSTSVSSPALCRSRVLRVFFIIVWR